MEGNEGRGVGVEPRPCLTVFVRVPRAHRITSAVDLDPLLRPISARPLPHALWLRSNAATSMKLASQYLEDAVIEEDIGQLLVLLARYADMAEAVHFAITEMDRMLMGDRT